MRVVVPPFTPDGVYQIDNSSAGKLGEGAFGVCHIGYHTATNTPVAVKISDRVDVANMEASVQKRLKHKNVVKLLSSQTCYQKQVSYLVMECCTGGELFDVISKCGAFHPTTAFNILLEIASGLAHCHARGVYHRDLKPENILLSGTGHVRISDFGLAKMARSSRVQVRHAYTRCGSTYYMAPEVLNMKGDGYDAAAADIWSLGIIVYTMLLGKPPWHHAEESSPEFHYFLEHGLVLPGLLPGAAVKLVMLMLDVNPMHRPSAQEVEFLVKALMGAGLGCWESPEMCRVQNRSPYEATASDIKTFCCRRTSQLLHGALSSPVERGPPPCNNFKDQLHRSGSSSHWTSCPGLESCESDRGEEDAAPPTSFAGCVTEAPLAPPSTTSCTISTEQRASAAEAGERRQQHTKVTLLRMPAGEPTKTGPIRVVAAADPAPLSTASVTVKGKPPCPSPKTLSLSLAPPSPPPEAPTLAFSSPKANSHNSKSPSPSPGVVPSSPSQRTIPRSPASRSPKSASPRSSCCAPSLTLKRAPSPGTQQSPAAPQTPPAPGSPSPPPCPGPPSPASTTATTTCEATAEKPSTTNGSHHAGGELPSHLRMRGPFRGLGSDPRPLHPPPLEDLRRVPCAGDWDRPPCTPRRQSGGESRLAHGNDSLEKAPWTPRLSTGDGRPVRLKPLWEQAPAGSRGGLEEHGEALVVDRAVPCAGSPAMSPAAETGRHREAHESPAGSGWRLSEGRHRDREEDDLREPCSSHSSARGRRSSSRSGSGGTSATQVEDVVDKDKGLWGDGHNRRRFSFRAYYEDKDSHTCKFEPCSPVGKLGSKGREVRELEAKISEAVMGDIQKLLRLVSLPEVGSSSSLNLERASSRHIAGPLDAVRLMQQSLRHGKHRASVGGN